MAAAISKPRAEEFTFRDEMDLRAYFAMELPPVPGEPSTFGAQCEARAASTNRRTRELPTPLVAAPGGGTSGAPWTEILECKPSIVARRAADVEAAVVAYVDARSRNRRVTAVLSRIDGQEADVLEAHYGSGIDAIKPLTAAIRAENRRRAIQGRHESAAETFRDLSRTMKNGGLAKGKRDATRAILSRARREASELLAAAHASYARARAEHLPCV